ncbi:MAG: enoyl-CoA hydratase/isomerase family protein [Firmicutes bacterium]|nr:enoyl-CoA hydratase/isomerase family protein [Bacillota bacterium]
MNQVVSVEISAPIAKLHFNGPPVNAMNLDFVSGLEMALQQIEEEPEISVLLLLSDLPKIFSAGADAKWFAQVLQERGDKGFVETFKAFSERLRSIMLRLHEGPWLSIAVLDGHAVAGGMELASACDFRFASDDDGLLFSLPEGSLFGAIPSGGGGTQYLVRLLGEAATLDLILSGAQLTPAEAHRMGWVNRLFQKSELLPQSEKYALQVGTHATRFAIPFAKRALYGLSGKSIGDAIHEEQALFFNSLDKIPFIDGVRNFSKRYGGHGGEMG